MEYLPKKPNFDEVLYSEQMDSVLSEVSQKCRAITQAPRRRFEREKFLSAIDEAFELIGGVPRFAHWADQNPTEFYRIMSKTIPQASLMDIQAKMSMQILPALPPSPLDGAIDITPEKTDDQDSQ